MITPGSVAWLSPDQPEDWVAVGNNYGPVTGAWLALAKLSTNRVALCEDGTLQALDFDGTDWTPVGSPFAVASIGSHYGMCSIDANTVVIARALSGYTFYKVVFDGANWSTVLTWNYSLSSVAVPAIMSLNATTLITVDQGTDRVRAFEWDGLAYNYRGFFAVNTTGPALCKLTDNSFALAENANNTLRAIQWNGSSFSQLAPQQSVASFGAPIRVSTLKENRIMLHTNSGRKIGTYDFSGSVFSLVGNEGVVLNTSMGGTSVATIDTNTVALVDNISDAIRVMRFV